ncbi:coiled-coil domain-containing protein, partial [Cellulomonas aerilata]
MTVHDRARTRRPAAALLSAGVLAGLMAPATAAAAPVTPSDDEARAARHAVASGQSAVAGIEVELARLSATRDEADVAARTAAEAYLRAAEDRDAAAAESAQAAQRLQDASVSMEAARRTLVAIAVQAGRSGGAVDGVEAFLSADGFDDMVDRSAALSRLGGKADRAVQQFRAAKVVADTLKRRADAAVDESKDAAAAAETALATAEQAEDEAQRAVAAAESQRESLIVQLAAARSTSAEIERARQDRVDAERAARVDAAALAQRTAAPSTAPTAAAPAAAAPAAAGRAAPAAPAPSAPPAPAAPPPAAPAPSAPPAA